MCWVPCLWSFARTKIFDFTLSRQRNQCQNSFLRYTFTVFIALFKTLFPRFIEELYRDEKTKHWVMTLPHLSLSLDVNDADPLIFCPYKRYSIPRLQRGMCGTKWLWIFFLIALKNPLLLKCSSCVTASWYSCLPSSWSRSVVCLFT